MQIGTKVSWCFLNFINCCWGNINKWQGQWSVTLNLSKLISPAIFLKQHCHMLFQRMEREEVSRKPNSLTSQALLSHSRPHLSKQLSATPLSALLLLSPDSCRAHGPPATMKLYPSSFPPWNATVVEKNHLPAAVQMKHFRNTYSILSFSQEDVD